MSKTVNDPVNDTVPDPHLMDERLSAKSRELLTFVSEMRSEDIPDEVIHASKRCLLDFLGVAIGASQQPAPVIVASQLQTMGGHEQSTVLGRHIRLRASDAALVNGIAGHVFDFDDTHIPTILHPSTPLYAAGLAVAEWRQRSGRELLAAHALGYELSARASLALYPEHYDTGWHMTGTTGTLGAAVAAGRLMQLPISALPHCIGLAATQASGHREQFGTMTKSFHAGHAAECGVMSSLLAEAGYTAAADSLEGRRGMFSVMSTRTSAGDLNDSVGQKWEIFRNGVKPYACGVVAHPPIDAVRALGVEHGVNHTDIERIDLLVNPLVAELTGKTDPRTGLEGKFSTRFACAIALIDGAARERQFTDVNVAREDVRELMSRIHLVPSADISHEAATVSAYLSDGRTLTVIVEAASGTPQNPFSDADLEEKFHDLVDPILGRTRASLLAEHVWTIEEATNVQALLASATPIGR